MSDRPTPEQILDDGMTVFRAADGMNAIRSKTGQEHIDALAEHSYVIVNPDDVFPVPDEATGSLYQNAWNQGWNHCRHIIFGDDQ